MRLKERAFSDCPQGKELWIQDGTIVRNLKGLAAALKKQDNFSFTYHVNDDHHKNDYAKWVMDVLGDRDLCSRLLKAKNEKKEFQRVVEERILELEIA